MNIATVLTVYFVIGMVICITALGLCMRDVRLITEGR